MPLVNIEINVIQNNQFVNIFIYKCFIGRKTIYQLIFYDVCFILKNVIKTQKQGVKMPKKTPRVSVLTPIYNTNPSHLREMIESILNQTFTDFEFLILNDSPDNTEIEKIVLEYAKHDKRIKYSKNEKNMGISDSRNKLLEMARGEYVAIFDHDDISMPTRLGQEVAVLDNHPEIGAVSGFLRLFGGKKENSLHKCPENDFEIKCTMCGGCYFSHTASMLRKSVLDENNIRYEAEFTPCEDFQLWNRLMDVTRFYCIQSVLVDYRNFDGNTTSKTRKIMGRLHGVIRADVSGRYPGHAKYFKRYTNMAGTLFRLRLFGFVPLLKIKNNKVYLFEIIPLFKIMWR